MISKRMIYAVAAVCLLPLAALAGDNNEKKPATKKYQIGTRSAIITNTMELSAINPAFNDLSTDGLKGAHHSSLYFLYTVNQWVSVGFETLTGNSDSKAKTSMDFQGAGLLLDFRYGGKYFVAGGVHLGGVIVDAVHREAPAAGKNVQSGTFYKSEGFFFAPYAAVGVNIKSSEIRVFAKPVFMASPEDDNIDGFNSTYVGLGYGYNF